MSVQVEQAFTSSLDAGASDLRRTLRTMLGTGPPGGDDTSSRTGMQQDGTGR